MEVRQEPLLALVQSLLRRGRLVEPRGESLSRPREAEVLKVPLDSAADGGEVVGRRGLYGGGDAVEEFGGLRGGADGGWEVVKDCFWGEVGGGGGMG